jgi:hypothetical protein
MEQQLIQALAWPVYDVPKIFEIASKGVGPALPGLIELGVTLGPPLIGFPIKKPGWRWTDIVMGYALAAGISFAFKAL